jgi:hypothetical protein
LSVVVDVRRAIVMILLIYFLYVFYTWLAKKKNVRVLSSFASLLVRIGWMSVFAYRCVLYRRRRRYPLTQTERHWTLGNGYFRRYHHSLSIFWTLFCYSWQILCCFELFSIIHTHTLKLD